MMKFKEEYSDQIYPIDFRLILFGLDYFIRTKTEITVDSFKNFLENDRLQLFENYQKLVPSKAPTYYHELVPFHANGLFKKEINYRDYFTLDNVNIKHFTSFIHHGDKHEHETKPFLTKTLNGEPKISKTNFTIIYCLTISRPSVQLIRQIEALWHDEVAFIIFYDNKKNRTILYELFESQIQNDKFKNVYIMDSPRFYVDWGRITQAFTEIAMNQAAIKFFPDSLYVSFHSESDYPLVPPGVVVKYLQQSYPSNYIQSLYDWGSQWKHKRREDFSFTFNDESLKGIDKVVRYLFPNKIMPVAEWRNGWNWFTMTLKDSKIMMEMLYKRFDLVDALEYCAFSEEIIFETLAAEANISTTNEYLRYIDWRTRSAHPLVYTERHFNDLISHRCSLWARKFIIGESDKVLDMIDAHIKNYPQNKEFVC